MASYLDFGFDTFLRVKIQKVGVIDAVYVPAISSDVVVDTSSIPVESIGAVYLNNDGLKVKDTDATHGLSIVPGSNLTSDRVLTLTTGDAARTLNLVASNTGTILRADGTNWVASTLTMPDTAAISTLLYSSATNVISALATGNSGVLVTGGTGVPSISTDIPTAVTIGSAYIYRASGTDVPVTDGGTGASDASTARSNLGLGSIATQASNNVSITGGSITSITDIAIADGGTGQSTKGAAFDALSPLTTKGDIVAYSTTNVRVGTSTDNTILVGDTSTAAGITFKLSTPYRRQNITTNSTGGLLTSPIQYGWGYELGDGTAVMSKSVTFPLVFTAAPVVTVSNAGALVGSNPTAIGDLTTASGATSISTTSITTTGFVVQFRRVSNDGTDPGAFGATTRYGFAWSAFDAQ